LALVISPCVAFGVADAGPDFLQFGGWAGVTREARWPQRIMATRLWTVPSAGALLFGSCILLFSSALAYRATVDPRQPNPAMAAFYQQRLRAQGRATAPRPQQVDIFNTSSIKGTSYIPSSIHNSCRYHHRLGCQTPLPPFAG
jgi:hypothetical protein